MSERGMTVRQWQWHYRDQMYAECEGRSMSTVLVDDTLAKMGVDLATQFPIGVGLTIHNQQMMTYLLPNGTAVESGEPSTRYYGVFRKVDNRWRPLLGQLNHPSTACRVIQVPGEVQNQDWIDAVADQAEALALVKFQQIAWRVGMELKHSRGWCDEYEEAMENRLGLTEDITRQASAEQPFRVGESLTPEQAATCPLGTVFRNQDGDQFFLRTVRASNRARTRACLRLRAGAVGHYSSRGMVLLAYPSHEETGHYRYDGWRVRLDQEMWDLLPAGLLLSTHRNAQPFVMCGNHLATNYAAGIPDWAGYRGSYRYHDFGAHEFWVLGLPTGGMS